MEDQSFRARRERDRELLQTSPIVPWPRLAAIQRRFRRSTREDTRRRIALEFERAVQEGAGADEKRPLREILEELGPPGSAERVINFFPRFFRHRKGPRAGEPFELDEFQQDFIREFFRRHPDGRRVYQRGYLIIPGGNGKSPLAAGLGVLGLAELEDAPEVYCIAGAKGQAGVVWGFASAFVKGDEAEPGELLSWLRVRSKIENRETGGTMEMLPSSGGLQEGKQPSIAIIDELWGFETKAQEATYVALAGKLHKRPDAYLLAISTAGRGSRNLLLRIVKGILKRAVIERRGMLTIARDEEAGTLLWMYQAPVDAPLEDLDVIRQVNPAPWLDPRDILRQLWDEGVGEAEFRRLARNEWVAVRNQWLQPGRWEKLADPDHGPPPAGAQVVLGFDGSYANDSTALVGWTVGEDFGFVVDVWERPEDDPNWLVPRREVREAVEAAMARWEVLELVCDPPGWTEEVEEWSRVYGDVVTVLFATNETKLMTQACREFFAGVVHETIRHDGDPRLTRHLANAHTRHVADGSYIVKEYPDSPNKIDAAVAAVLARYRALRAKPRRRRVYSWS